MLSPRLMHHAQPAFRATWWAGLVPPGFPSPLQISGGKEQALEDG